MGTTDRKPATPENVFEAIRGEYAQPIGGWRNYREVRIWTHDWFVDCNFDTETITIDPRVGGRKTTKTGEKWERVRREFTNAVMRSRYLNELEDAAIEYGRKKQLAADCHAAWYRADDEARQAQTRLADIRNRNPR